jgi:hypothetical protein
LNATQTKRKKGKTMRSNTAYEAAVVRDIHRDVANRKKQYCKQYGKKFVDVITVGEWQDGIPFYISEFRQNYSGRNLVFSGLMGFVKHVYGSGSLRKIDEFDNCDYGKGIKYVVLSV